MIKNGYTLDIDDPNFSEILDKTLRNIGDIMNRTNVYNDFQGDLRYGYLNLNDAEDRIVKNFSHVMEDKHFTHNIAITYCNEFKPSIEGKYYSDNPFEVKENR